MQQGGSQYGMSPEMTPFSTTASATTRTHMLGVSTSSSSSDHLPQQQQQQQHQPQPPQPQHHHQQQQQKSGDAAGVVAEAASPISSRPPPLPPAVGRPSGNFDELVPVSGSGGFGDDDGLGGEEADRGVSGGNRWPRQETLALLKIRSEMDGAFRDATLKGPLWEDVSRKLAEQGYIRSAKKCKEKFENVHKYYKRTKEGRAGRQDGKSYRFFSQLEALHSGTNAAPIATATATSLAPVNLAATPVSIGIAMASSSSGRMQTPPDLASSAAPSTTHIVIPRIGPPDLSAGLPPGQASGSSSAAAAAAAAAAAGISFSSNTSSSSSDSEDDLEGGPSNTHSRKRKRGSGDGGGGSSSSSSRKMMDFFEGLMKQVMEKQEAMQQRFLEAIEKREQDRMIREEAWKRQEMARLTREHDLMAQERAISASRDAAIIAFLQKITGQTIQLPPAVVIPAVPPPVPVAQSTAIPVQPTPPPQQHHQQQHQHHHPPSTEIVRHQNPSSEIVLAAVPEQQHPPQEMVVGGSGGVGFDPTSSRWPKAEVLALIKLRSGLESRYQEAGPKGPLWEEISAGMQRMGYNRSAKRCKEKWENINKYFKKVKESNKKRPEDAKTCPYFHQLDALYRKKMLSGGGGGGSSSSGGFGNQNKQQEQQQMETTVAATMDANQTANLQSIMAAPQPLAGEAEGKKSDDNNNKKNGGNTEVQTTGNTEGTLEEGSSGGGRGGGSGAASKKPEDIMKEQIEHGKQLESSVVMEVDYDKLEGPDSDNNIIDQDEEEEEEEDEEEEDEEGEDDGEETEEEERKMGYEIQFQRQNAGSTNGGGNAASASSFLAMVQ